VKIEPRIDRASLVAAVRVEYGIEAEDLSFVPVGFVAVCYVVRVSGTSRYFLKLWPDTRVVQENLANLDPSLRLTRALYDRDLFRRVPYPLWTRKGYLRADYRGQLFALFPFLDGTPAPLWAELSLFFRDEFARTVAAIHRATPRLADVLPPREVFDIPFEPALREGLDAVGRIGPRARPGLQSLRAWILPHRDEVLDQLDRLHRLQDSVRALNGPRVLIHGDHGGDNLLIDADGRMFVLDWDGATIGPPEFDFHSALGDGFARFLQVYREAGGSGPWYLDNFAFSLLRRALGDFAARLLGMLEEDFSPDEDDEALHGMESWGFRRWRELDKTLNAIKLACPEVVIGS